MSPDSDDSDLPPAFFWNRPSLPVVNLDSTTEESEPNENIINKRHGGSSARQSLLWGTEDERSNKPNCKKTHGSSQERSSESGWISDSDDEPSEGRWHSVQKQSQGSARGSQGQSAKQVQRTPEKFEMTFTGGTYSTCSLEPSPDKNQHSSPVTIRNVKDKDTIHSSTEREHRKQAFSRHFDKIVQSQLSKKGIVREKVKPDVSERRSRSQLDHVVDTTSSSKKECFNMTSKQKSKIDVISLDSDNDFDDMPVIKINDSHKKHVCDARLRSDSDFEIVASSASEGQSQSVLRTSASKGLYVSSPIQEYASSDDDSFCTVIAADAKNAQNKESRKSRPSRPPSSLSSGHKYGSDIDDSGTSGSDEPITMYKYHTSNKPKKKMQRRTRSVKSSSQPSTCSHEYPSTSYAQKISQPKKQTKRVFCVKKNKNLRVQAVDKQIHSVSSSRCTDTKASKQGNQFDPRSTCNDDTLSTTTDEDSDQPLCDKMSDQGIPQKRQACRELSSDKPCKSPKIVVKEVLKDSAFCSNKSTDTKSLKHDRNVQVIPGDNNDVLSSTTDDKGDSDETSFEKVDKHVNPETTSSSDIELPSKAKRSRVSPTVPEEEIDVLSVTHRPCDNIIKEQAQSCSNKAIGKNKRSEPNVINSDEELFDNDSLGNIANITASSDNETIDISSDISMVEVGAPKDSDLMMPSLVLEDISKDPKWKKHLDNLHGAHEVDKPSEMVSMMPHVCENQDSDEENLISTIAETQAGHGKPEQDEILPKAASKFDDYIEAEFWDSDESSKLSFTGEAGQERSVLKHEGEKLLNHLNEDPVGASPVLTPDRKSFHLPENQQNARCFPNALGHPSPLMQSLIHGHSNQLPHHSTPAAGKYVSLEQGSLPSSPILEAKGITNDSTLEEINESLLLLEKDDSFEFHDSQIVNARITGTKCSSAKDDKDTCDAVESKGNACQENNHLPTPGSVGHHLNNDLNTGKCKGNNQHNGQSLKTDEFDRQLKKQGSGSVQTCLRLTSDPSGKPLIQTLSLGENTCEKENQEISGINRNDTLTGDIRKPFQDPVYPQINYHTNDVKKEKMDLQPGEEDLFEDSQWLEEGDGVEDEMIMATAAAVEKANAYQSPCCKAESDGTATVVTSAVISDNLLSCDDKSNGEGKYKSEKEMVKTELCDEAIGPTGDNSNDDAKLSDGEKWETELPDEIIGQTKVRFNPNIEVNPLSPVSKEDHDSSLDDSFTLFSQVDSEVIVLSDDSDTEPVNPEEVKKEDPVNLEEVKKEETDSLDEFFGFDDFDDDSDIFLIDDNLDDDVKNITVKKEDQSWWDDDTFSQVPRCDSPTSDLGGDAIVGSDQNLPEGREVTVERESSLLWKDDVIELKESPEITGQSKDGTVDNVSVRSDENKNIVINISDHVEDGIISEPVDGTKKSDSKPGRDNAAVSVTHVFPKETDAADDFVVADEPQKKSILQDFNKNKIIRTVHAISQETEDNDSDIGCISLKPHFKDDRRNFEDDSTDEDEPVPLEIDVENVSDDELSGVLSMHYHGKEKAMKRKRTDSGDEDCGNQFSSVTKTKRNKSEHQTASSDIHGPSTGKPHQKTPGANVFDKFKLIPDYKISEAKPSRHAIQIEHQHHVGGKSNHRVLKFQGTGTDTTEEPEWLSKSMANYSGIKSSHTEKHTSATKDKHLSTGGPSRQRKPSGPVRNLGKHERTSYITEGISEARRKMMERQKMHNEEEKRKEKQPEALNKDKPLIFCTNYREQEKKVTADIKNANKNVLIKTKDGKSRGASDGKKPSEKPSKNSESKSSKSHSSRPRSGSKDSDKSSHSGSSKPSTHSESKSSKSHSGRSQSGRKDSGKSHESKSGQSQSAKHDKSRSRHDSKKSEQSKSRGSKSSDSKYKDSKSDKSNKSKHHSSSRSSRERHSSKDHKSAGVKHDDLKEKDKKKGTSSSEKVRLPSGEENKHKTTSSRANEHNQKSGTEKKSHSSENRKTKTSSNRGKSEVFSSHGKKPVQVCEKKDLTAKVQTQKAEKEASSHKNHDNVLVDVKNVKKQGTSCVRDLDKKKPMIQPPPNVPDMSNPAFNLVDQITAGSCFKKPAPVAKNSTPASGAEGGLDITSGAVITEEDFLASVLRWNARWLDEQKKNPRVPPPILDAHCLPGIQAGPKSRLYPLLESGYSSFHEYLSIVLPLLLYETWAGLFSSWSQLRSPFDFQLLQTNNFTEDKLSAKTHSAQFQGVFRPSEKSHPASPKEGSLLILSISTVRDGQKIKSQMLGYISKLMWFPVRGPRKMHAKLASDEKLSDPRCMFCQATIKLYKRGKGEAAGSWVSGRVLGSIITGMRQLTAILALRESRLFSDILRPTNIPSVFCTASPSETCSADLRSLNPSQLDVVLSVAHAVRQPYVEPKICLIQGPPGTGKSHTIITLIRTILKQKMSGGQRPRILLTAPSNAAVDELMKRLVKDRQQSGLGSNGPKFVRLGRTVHPKLLEFSLDELVQAEAEAEACKFLPESVRRELITMRRRLRTINEDIQNATDQQEKSNKLNDKSKLLKKINLLCGDNKSYRPPRDIGYADHIRLRRQVLFNMDVICCTLNTSGCRWLLEMLGNTQNGQPFFSCCIVDEACQTTEADCLIPLQYNCTKLVLVGDPKQLPATIISSKAEELNFGQSLFERFFNFFSDMAIPPVKMLSVQYRMHPEICYFPNHHMYDGRLSTDMSVHKRSQFFPFRPYALFDLHYSQEEQQGTNVQNMSEVHFICTLCQYLMHRGAMAQAIGIISPYKGQKTALARALGSRNLDIEIDTVDSFQGREKDIIIFTCVRANADKGIGFLKERRRMNVALTRARYALYIVGHMATLKGNHDFKSLVYDASKRNHVIPVHTERENAFDKWLCYKPPPRPPHR